MKPFVTFCFSVMYMLLICQDGIAQSYPVYNGQTLSQGFDMAVNTNNGVTNWLHNMNGYMRLDYPANQSWGFVMITYGTSSSIQSQRQFRNFSNFKTLSVEMKGLKGGEQVELGLKDISDPDNGSETKIPRQLTDRWQVYTFDLSSFKTADLYHLYVVIEFVFTGPTASTIFFRNVTYN